MDGRVSGLRAFTHLYTTPAAGLVHYVTQIVRDRHAASDIVHDTLIKAFERDLASVAGDPPIASWLYRVAHNAALDHLRRGRRSTLEEPAAVAQRGESEAGEPLEWGTHGLIHAALDRLPAAQRDVTVLRLPGRHDADRDGDRAGKDRGGRPPARGSRAARAASGAGLSRP